MTKTNKVADVFAINAIQPALVKAHEDGNRHAITKKEAEDAGVLGVKFEQWCNWTNNLRDAVSPYVIKKMDKDATEVQLQRLRGKIFPAWRKIVLCGEDDPVHPNLVVTSADVDSLVGFCETYFGTEKGTVWSVKSQKLFRKDVEAYLGCKIAQNAVLEDEDRDCIKDYQKATRAIKKAEEALNGKETKDGKENGILDEIKIYSTTIQNLASRKLNMEKLFNQLPKEQQATADFLAKEIENLKKDMTEVDRKKTELENQKAQFEKNIKKAEQVIADNKEQYDAIMARIKKIQ